MTVQHRQQQRQPVLLKADRKPPRVRRMRLVDQRLHLDQQRSRALLRHQHAGTCDLGVMLREEQRRGIGHAFQPLVGHRKDAELVDCTVAVLEGADQTKTGMRVTLKIKHGIDHMLEHARPGQRTFLGDMADKNDGGTAGLGEPRQLRRTFAHLRHRTRRRGQCIGIQGLDRVDDGDIRLFGLDHRLDFRESGFRQHLHMFSFDIEPLRAQRDLLRRFLARHIDDLASGADGGQRLQQQRRLADARITADQDHRARHQPAAEHTVEL